VDLTDEERTREPFPRKWERKNKSTEEEDGKDEEGAEEDGVEVQDQPQSIFEAIPEPQAASA
jgi:hypothetical protein